MSGKLPPLTTSPSLQRVDTKAGHASKLSSCLPLQKSAKISRRVRQPPHLPPPRRPQFSLRAKAEALDAAPSSPLARLHGLASSADTRCTGGASTSSPRHVSHDEQSIGASAALSTTKVDAVHLIDDKVLERHEQESAAGLRRAIGSAAVLRSGLLTSKCSHRRPRGAHTRPLALRNDSLLPKSVSAHSSIPGIERFEARGASRGSRLPLAFSEELRGCGAREGTFPLSAGRPPALALLPRSRYFGSRAPRWRRRRRRRRRHRHQHWPSVGRRRPRARQSAQMPPTPPIDKRAAPGDRRRATRHRVRRARGSAVRPAPVSPRAARQ